jgi:4-cresol dehydrogenase (hydroxylating)
MRDFLQRCEERLGRDFVDRGPESLDAASRATYATSQRVLAILRPGSVDEISECLRLATEYRVPVYPISGGRNWGLGSRVPPSDAVLLDLSRLNRILDFNEELAYLVVEPGVTFRQAYEFLAARTSRVYLAGIGGPPDASVLGNCVERGDGVGMTGERLPNLCGLEIVLPDGQRVELGFTGMGRTPLAPLSRNAAGPQLDGLFTQSNLGVVTRAAIWLSPRPAFPQLITCRIGSRDALPEFVDRLRGLMQNGLIQPSSFAIWNSWKMAVRTGNRAAAPGDEWHSSGSLYGCSPDHGAAVAALVRQALAPATAELAIWAPAESERFPGLFGEPVEDNAQSVYWAKPGGAPSGRLDPDRDGCGVVWLCPAVAFSGSHVRDVVAAIERIVPQFGLDPVAGMQCVNPRSIHAFVSLLYDRDEPGADARAMACHDRLFEELASLGAHPYRLGIHSMQRWRQSGDPYAALVDRLKAAVDPVRILAPGRYELG